MKVGEGFFKGRARGGVVLLLLAVVVAGYAVAQTDSMSLSYTPRFPGDPARSQAEAMALGYMRTVVDAQRQYRKKQTKYATSLNALVGSGSFTKRMLRTDRGEYTATFLSTGKGQNKGQKFSLQLIPKQFDSTHRAFFVNETGTIRVQEEQPASAESPVLKADRPAGG